MKAERHHRSAPTLVALALGHGLVRTTVAALVVLQVMLWSRLLEPDEYAVYALVIGAAALLRMFFFNWIGAVVVRFLPDQEVDPEVRTAGAVTVFLALVVILLLLFLLAVPWLDRVAPLPLTAIALVIAISSGWLEMSHQLSRARLEHHRLALKLVGFELSKLALGLVLILGGWHEYGLLGATIGALLVTSLLWLRPDGILRVDRRALRRPVIEPMLRYGWPLAVSAGLTQLTSVVDRYMLLWLIDEAAAGGYALAFEMARQPVWMVMVAASTAVMPLATRAMSLDGVDAAKNVLRSHATVLLMLSLPVVAVEIAFARPLTSLLVGEAYRDVGFAIMPIVALSALVVGWRSFHLDLGTHLLRRSQAFIGLGLAVVTVDVIMNAILIPLYGVVGAASATLVAQVAGVVYFFMFVPRAPVLSVSWPSIGKTLLALGAAVAAGAMIDTGRGGLWPLLPLGLGGATYLAVLMLLGVADLGRAPHPRSQ